MIDLSHIKAICFDVDSTVCPDEGIDKLAAYCNKEAVVSQITTQAMDGTMGVTEALEQRLSILGLSKDLIRRFLDDTPLQLTPGVERLFASLRSSNVEVYLVSGGIFELVDRVAKKLRVPEDHVFANRLIYSDDGVVVDFDRQQPTSRSDGKKEVVATIKSQLSGDESKMVGVLVVGDGVTDAAACPPADAFLGFGGVITRPSVQRATPFFFHSFDEMHTFLQHCGLIAHSS
ncbi:phosphoserine phosphatase [Echinococcus multilocularis]|uniref:Phosphoserine phosphatase n=1 Tax=Echinococcus multilocularis TaxID=6211 RepID=A0A068YL93_ECHMU|nr:phosphoserine phosphatase [Echinococcus multilocularis]